MTPPTWLATPALKLAGWAVRSLDRALAIRIEVDGERIPGGHDEWNYVIRIFNGTKGVERIHTLQLTFSGGAPPLSLAVPDEALVDQTHAFERKYEEFIVSAHESEYEHRLRHTVRFSGVRVRFHSGRDVWRPASGWRPMSWWHRVQWRLKRRLRRLRSPRRPA